MLFILIILKADKCIKIVGTNYWENDFEGEYLLVKGESFERSINAKATYENGTSQLIGIKLRSWMTVKMNPFVFSFISISNV
jgi:hypothetical protein